MVKSVFEVLTPGLQTTIQDWPGRIGYWRIGIPPSGPMDELSFRRANLLVENDQGAPALEVQFMGPKLKVLSSCHAAISGGICRPILNDVPVEMNRTFMMKRGDVLDIGAVRTGARTYLAVTGSFDKEKVLGSSATFPRAKIGGGTLAAGEVLRLASDRKLSAQWRLKRGCEPERKDN